MPEEKIDQIDLVEEKTEAAEPMDDPSRRKSSSSQARFNAIMDEEKVAPLVVPPKDLATKSSLMDVVRDMNYSGSSNGKATFDSLTNQTNQAITKIKEIKEVLGTPDVNIKSSARKLLQDKLTHIDESLRFALTEAGLENIRPETKSARGNPIARFLSFLTDGQWQLEKLGGELQAMSASKQEMTPVNMLAIQVKISQVQQELELFSSLLNKALESIKTIMNIQV